MGKEKKEIKLKRLLDELYALDVQRTKLAIQISRAKRSLIENYDLVGIVYISRFLECCKRDTFFLRFLDRHPDGYLFVLAFADSESESYHRAEEIADLAYDQDINSIREDTDKALDACLCSFLCEHSSEEDLKWVYDLIEKKDWFKSYKMVTSALIELENSSSI